MVILIIFSGKIYSAAKDYFEYKSKFTKRRIKMAVKIRLRRLGAKKKPFYRIIVADSRSPRNGRFIEEIGYYDPNTEPYTIKVDADAAKKWLNNGAIPSATCDKLLKNAGITK